MKISVLQENFVAAGKIAGAATTQKSSLAVLGMIALKHEGGVVTLRATNLEAFVEVKVEAKVLENDGAVGICFPLDVIRYIETLDPVAVSLEIDHTKITVRQGEESSSWQGIDILEFPLTPTVGDKITQVPGELLKDILTRTGYAVAADDTRLALGGVHIVSNGDTVFAEATDGFRGARVEVDKDYLSGPAFNVNIPRGSVNTLLKLVSEEDFVNVYLSLANSRVSFDMGSVILHSQLTDAQFPEMAPIWPKAVTYEMDVFGEAFSRHIKRVAVGLDRSSAIEFVGTGKDNELQLIGHNAEKTASSTATCLMKGALPEDVLLSVNYQFLQDTLKVVNETAKLRITDKFTPLVITEVALPDGIVSAEHIIMPMVFGR